MKRESLWQWWRSALAVVLVTLALAACGSNDSSTPPPPVAPANVSATAGDSQVAVSWNTVTGATSYNVHYSTTTGTELTSGTKFPNATSPQVITGLTNGTTYFFVVTAVNANGESIASSEVTATPVPPVPAKPAGVVATAGDGQVIVQWTAVAGLTYNIYYSTTSGQELTSGTKFPNAVTPQTITGLQNGIQYFFVVTAVNAGGESAASSEKTATPAATPQPPGSPTGVSVTSPSVGQVHVVWNTVSTATSYNVYYLQSSSASAPNNVQTAGTKVNTATEPFDLTLTSGLQYWFLVTAVNAAGESAAQNNPKSVTVQ